MKHLFFYLSSFLIFSLNAIAQNEVRAELFLGNKSPALDVFFIKPFSQHSAFTFLSRSKIALPDYKSGNDEFISTNIVSYEIEHTGFGIAAAAKKAKDESLNGRAGFQYLKNTEKLLFYSILSTKLADSADARLLSIFQFVPELTNIIKLFTRAEWETSINYNGGHNFTQSIIRIGLEANNWQFGLGSELFWRQKAFDFEEGNYGVFITKKI
jgi:hypothetical protein